MLEICPREVMSLFWFNVLFRITFITFSVKNWMFIFCQDRLVKKKLRILAIIKKFWYSPFTCKMIISFNTQITDLCLMEYFILNENHVSQIFMMKTNLGDLSILYHSVSNANRHLYIFNTPTACCQLFWAVNLYSFNF